MVDKISCYDCKLFFMIGLWFGVIEYNICVFFYLLKKRMFVWYILIFLIDIEIRLIIWIDVYI